jgi:hypothetical protein
MEGVLFMINLNPLCIQQTTDNGGCNIFLVFFLYKE